jgi:hypothetical protein
MQKPTHCAQGIETLSEKRALTPLVSLILGRIVYAPKSAM